jgi:hypothetical protein
MQLPPHDMAPGKTEQDYYEGSVFSGLADSGSADSRSVKNKTKADS